VSDPNVQNKSVEDQEPLSNQPSASSLSSTLSTPPSSADSAESQSSSTADTAEKVVTTVQRKPLAVPDSVHLQITPEKLKDYVGPPVYQKDRMYVKAPPAGVSTGLGYLGNGSGAVMPVEAMVRLPCLLALTFLAGADKAYPC